MKLLCPDGGHEVKVRFNPAPGERFCPEHGCSLIKPPKSSGLNSARREGLPGEAAARSRFAQVVKQRPCFFLDVDEYGERRRPDHVCTYPLDAHHLIAKGWIRRELSSMPDDELVELMWNPLIGAPLCRGAHNQVERGTGFVYRDELNPDLIAYCERFDAQHPEQRSILERLYLDCPVRKAAV